MEEAPNAVLYTNRSDVSFPGLTYTVLLVHSRAAANIRLSEFEAALADATMV